jgi:predicted translin family RNA/ssDNA-binding protein
MKPKDLVKILEQAIKLADQNIYKVDNFDLEDFSQRLEKYVDELNEIKEFEKYDDDDE